MYGNNICQGLFISTNHNNILQQDRFTYFLMSPDKHIYFQGHNCQNESLTTTDIDSFQKLWDIISENLHAADIIVARVKILLFLYLFMPTGKFIEVIFYLEQSCLCDMHFLGAI